MMALASAAYSASTPYISGEITSTREFMYGRFVGKMTCPDRAGSTIGFFTEYNQPVFNIGNWESIEMEIVPSLEPTPLSLDLSYGDGTYRIQE